MSLLKILDRPIAFHRCFVEIGIGINGALMLSQAMYWSNRTSDPDGWFYKTMEEWREETGLTRREQDSARRALRLKRLMFEEKRGVPCKIYFKINEKELFHALNPNVQPRMAESANLEWRNPPTKDGGTRQPRMAEPANLLHRLHTETTTETTSEEEEGARGTRPHTTQKFTPPSVVDVLEYMEARGSATISEAEKFCDFYESKGWLVGKAKMKSWQAAVRNWLKRAGDSKCGTQFKTKQEIIQERNAKAADDFVNDRFDDEPSEFLETSYARL